jgi:hypothetical protein
MAKFIFGVALIMAVLILNYPIAAGARKAGAPINP